MVDATVGRALRGDWIGHGVLRHGPLRLSWIAVTRLADPGVVARPARAAPRWRAAAITRDQPAEHRVGPSPASYSGSRSSGQVMQWPPPRPLPSSKPSISIDLDAGLAHLGDRVGVALVGDDDAGLEGDDVVAVVPLLALLLVGVAAGLDDVELGDAEGVGDGAEEVLLLGDVEVAAGSPGRRLIARMLPTTFG